MRRGRRSYSSRRPSRRRSSNRRRSRGNARPLALIAIIFVFTLTLAPPIKNYFTQRAQISALAPLQNIKLLPYGTHGAALQAQIAKSGGIVNLHFSAGVYSEYPRILTAALAGKVIWSDPMAQPLICGQHYFALTDKPSLAEQSAVYHRFCSDFAAKHRLSDFLHGVLPA